MTAAPAILVLDAGAIALGRRLAEAVGGDLHGLAGRADEADVRFASVLEHAQALFTAGRPMIGICAAGILIRAVGGLASDKHAEPPVLVVSHDGASVVPLLGGHRGANDLAGRIAGVTGGHAAVTTAGDTVHGVALDADFPCWRLANPGDAKRIMARIVGGEAFGMDGELPFRIEGGSDGAAIRLIGSDRPVETNGSALVWHPQRYVLGVGSARNCPVEELSALVDGVLKDAGVAPGAVACIASIDLKADELAMLELSSRLAQPFRLFDAAALEAETPRLANPSETVFAEVGCHGVAEAAALAAAGSEAELVVAKRKSANATAALARAPQPVDPLQAGRARGAVHVIGIGPGRADWRSPEAARRIAAADDIVGYGLYLDLVADLAPRSRMTEFPLGQETERCAWALERAAEGRTVALISSGDAGIYAMAALVEELVADGKVSEAARRVEVSVTPGISALQAAAARSGAPLGHDFCAISLSDLLTPWPVIERRIRAAAEGDFVIAFYNPVSKRRRTQLAAAKDILLGHRPPSTPVILATDLGRPAENVRVIALEDLQVDEVDMLTTVMVGSSDTRTYQAAGRARVFTPRGYAGKDRT
ncbi:MAG: precorrin-3B C(17)-methyltransferase [Minwuia sp.]|uniref:precorrin-3B C(17)-methyltransferase n=1 Tax=Minwuia sp. TaxID=2493630 RepID=UPI003A867925